MSRTPALSFTLSVRVYGGAATTVGQLLIPDGTGFYVAATAANRATYAHRTEAISLEAYGGAQPGGVSIQEAGTADAVVSLLGAGAASWVRCSTAGIAERFTPANAGTSDVIGWCETDGRLHLLFGVLTETMVVGGGGGSGIPAPATPANGDLLIYSAGAWSRLPVGSTGQLLQVVSGLPAWVSPAFDPAALSLTGFWKDYAGAPWSGSSSAGPSGGRGLATGTAPSVGANFGTHPSASFNGTTQSLTSSTLALDSYFTTKAMTGAPSLTFAAAGNTVTRLTGSFVTDGFVVGDIVAISGSTSNNTNGRALTAVSATALTFASGIVNETTTAAAIVVSSYFVQVDFQASSASAAGAAGFNDAPLFADNQGNVYLTFTSSGVRAGHYDGSYHTTSFIACSTSAKHCAQMWHDGATISARVDGGAPVTIGAGAMAGQSACLPKIGANFNGTAFFAGLKGRILVANNPLTPTIRDQLRADSQANYGTI